MKTAIALVAATILLGTGMTMSPVSAVDSERWWALAQGGRHGMMGTYGAAWNFPTEAAARAAALAECEKRRPRGSSPCYSGRGDVGNATNKSGCFGVYSSKYPDGAVLYVFLHWNKTFPERATVRTGTDVRRLFNEEAATYRKRQQLALEMYHCPRSGETWTR